MDNFYRQVLIKAHQIALYYGCADNPQWKYKEGDEDVSTN